jgi:hypothetical protein
MSKIQAARTVQRILTAEFAFNYNDWSIDSVSLVKTTYGSTTALADPSSAVSGLTAGTGITFDCIPMPIGAVIMGGAVIVETAFAGIGAAAVLNLGVAGNTSALVSAMDLDAATSGSRTAISLTAPLLCNAGQNIRLTTSGLTAAATAGKVRVRVDYTIDGKADEVVVA